MSHEAILALISELYMQLSNAQARIKELEAEPEKVPFAETG